MPYRQGNFSYVIDSSFNPFSFNEMLAPFQMYKQEYEKQEERVNDRIKAAGKFAYLADITDNDDPAKKIYQGYVNDLMAQANDLSANGLTMGNRRSITDIWRRYDTEIGALERADERMRKDMDVRSQLRAKGVHMLYANENPKLSDYLYENSPNQFGISTDDLYKSGANLGKSLSSREYAPGKDAGSTLGGFYRVWEEARGVAPENLGEFMNRPSTQALIRNALIAQGANNLTGKNLEEAQSAFMQGMYDNIMYEKSYKPYEDKGKMTPYQEAQLAQSAKQLELQANLYGYKERGKESTWVPDESLPNVKSKYGSTGSGSTSSGSSSGGRSGAGYVARNKDAIMVGAKSGKVYRHTDDDKSIGTPIENTREARLLSDQEVAALVGNQPGAIANPVLRQALGTGGLNTYEVFVIPAKSTKVDGTGYFWDDDLDEDVFYIRPRVDKRPENNPVEFDEDDGSNDVGF